MFINGLLKERFNKKRQNSFKLSFLFHTNLVGKLKLEYYWGRPRME